MDGELPRRNLVFADGFFDELFGQFRAFPGRNHPARDVAAEDVQDGVEIIALPAVSGSKDRLARATLVCARYQNAIESGLMLTITRLALLSALFVFAAGTALADLNAAAGCVNGRVVVQNRESSNWFQVKIEVNSVYVHTTDVIAAGDTMRFFPNIFTKSDGTRLDLSRVACKTIDVHATVGGKRQHWNGAYK
jgi:molybdopterin converting factor small subunit